MAVFGAELMLGVDGAGNFAGNLMRFHDRTVLAAESGPAKSRLALTLCAARHHSRQTPKNAVSV
jgi:hypothetical protein